MISSWLPPEEFDGFELRAPIGEGGMGRVFLAHELSLDRPVALKFIAGNDPGPDARARFQQEARAIARLQHPNVVAIYRIGEVEGRPYIAYEYVQGRSLDRVQTPVTWTRALEIGVAVARGLAVAHQRGVLHRDIKPANIILADDGAIKLVDFGLAKLLVDSTPEPEASAAELASWVESLNRAGSEHAARNPMTLRDAGTKTGSLVGTPNYLSPEVWRGERASSRSDVYALGLVLYELCSGQLPFAGLTGKALMDRVLGGALPPLASTVRDVPSSFAAIVDRAAAYEPAQRFADGGELFSALEVVESVLRGFRLVGSRRGRLDDASLVSASLSRVQARADALMTSFYEHFFEVNPEVAALFPASLQDQKMMLAAALRLAVDNLHHPEKIVAVLEDLGRRHASYGVQPQHFKDFEDALVETLKEFDRASWDGPTEQAWRRAFAAIADAMRRGFSAEPTRAEQHV